MRGDSHGGNLYLASEKFGIDENEFLDYSANINPLGVPEELEILIKSNISKLVNYPNIDYSLLVSQVSSYLDISKENITVGNGATEIIYVALEVLKAKKALIPVPTFSEYKGACFKFNIEIDYFNLSEEDDFKLKPDRFISAIKDDIDIIFLCNPNNPTSTLMTKAEVESIIDHANRKGIAVILDESFIDLVKDGEVNSLMGSIEKYKNLIIVRSFTKFFGIPGLRLGCGICNSNLASSINKNKIPWSINYFATLVGEIMQKDSSYVDGTRTWIKTEVDWFYEELMKFKDLRVFKPNTNFVLVKLLNDSIDSVSLRDQMGKQGVLIRDCSNFNNLNNRYVRFAIKDREHNIDFLKVLNSILN